jgi:hypothetical protein
MQLEKLRNLSVVVTSGANQDQVEFVQLIRTTICAPCTTLPDVFVVQPGAFNVRAGLAQLQATMQCHNQLYLASRVDTDCVVMLRALAALHYVLQRQYGINAGDGNVATADDDESASGGSKRRLVDRAVLGVQQIVLGSLMYVDRNTLEALRIVPSARAPRGRAPPMAVAAATRALKLTSATGEHGKRAHARVIRDVAPIESLQALLLRDVCSALGRARMNRWLLAPMQSADGINQRLDAVAYFVAPAGRALMAPLRAVLSKVR